MAQATTPIVRLPLLQAGQAQKEVTHNEALVVIDALLAGQIESVNATTPPASADIGRMWALGGTPTGAWTGQAGTLAIATAGGWRFAGVAEGFRARLRDTGALWQKGPTAWDAPPTVSAPAGGTVIDGECRAAVSSLLSALASAGLVTVD